MFSIADEFLLIRKKNRQQKEKGFRKWKPSFFKVPSRSRVMTFPAHDVAALKKRKKRFPEQPVTEKNSPWKQGIFDQGTPLVRH